MRKPRRPTHTLRVKVRDTDNQTNTIGKAWLNEDGSMSISLSPGVVLKWDDPFFITAFPINNKEQESA